jgi:UDP:flavonoid glycosyltransferase YjiC (YdhE family)
MAVLARELEGRGHRVTFLGFPDMAPRLPAGLAFRPFAERDQPLGSLEPYLDRLSRLGGPVSMWRFIHDLARFTDVICRELPGALERVAPDALIIDQTDAAASLVATALGVPFVNIANALPLNLEPALPPPVLPWPYDPSPKGLRRNQGGYRVARFVERPDHQGHPPPRRTARAAGDPIRDETWSERAQITQCVQGLDFPRAQLPDSFHYVGPFRETDAPLDFDLPDDGRPVIFCSFGSLQGIARRAVPGRRRGGSRARRHPGHRPWRAASRSRDRPPAGTPRRARLRSPARPACPLRARDHPCRVQHRHGRVELRRADGRAADHLRATGHRGQTGARRRGCRPAAATHGGADQDAIQEVLSNPSYRESAGRLRTEIGSAGGVRRAADLIEQVV